MNLLKHLPQFQWPFRSGVQRRLESLAEERSGSGDKRATKADVQGLGRLIDDFLAGQVRRTDDLEQRVSALEKARAEHWTCLRDLAGRATALEERADSHGEWLDNLTTIVEQHERWLEAASLSPATERATTDSPSDAQGRVYTIPGHQPFSLSDPRITNAGPAGHDSGSAEQVDAST